MSSTFCPLPWISLSTRNDGPYRVCCNANQSESRGIYTSADGAHLNAASASIPSTRNAPLAKDIRKAMLQGEWHSACKRCREEEATGLTSRRQIEAPLWDHAITFDRARALTDGDGRIDTDVTPLRHIDLRFGNKCNLKCRSCSPSSSHSWYADHLAVWGETFNEANYKVQLQRRESDGRLTPSPNPYNWHESPTFWQELEQQIPSLNMIYFAGGEPLLIEAHFKFLERCIEDGHAANITIEYNTNLTVLPDHAFELWRHFKNVHFGVSIDGVGPVNEYIRHPSRWPAFEKNLQRLDQAPGPYVVWLVPTVMVYNILHLPELMLWVMQNNFSRVQSNLDQPLFFSHPLHNPQFLNIQSFKAHEKREIQLRLLQQLPHLKAAARKIEDPNKRERAAAQCEKILRSYIDFMWRDDLSHLRSKFSHYSRTLDRVREESLAAAMPELAALIGYHRQTATATVSI